MKTRFDIKNTNGILLYTCEADSLKDAVEQAIKQNIPLCQANLENSILQEADLRNGQLEGTSFKNAHLENVQFDKANLEGVNVEGAYIQGTNFGEYNLYGFILRKIYRKII